MSGRPAPPKPWERRGAPAASTTTPLGPSTANDGAPKPWETATPVSTAPVASTSGALAAPRRPWEAGSVSTAYGGNGGYGSSSYGGAGYGSAYGGYGGSSYGGGYGGSSYGGGYGGSSMYGRPAGYGGVGSSYGGGYGGGMYGGGYGMGGMGGGYGMGGYGGGYGMGGGAYGALGGPPGVFLCAGGPFSPEGGPPQPPSAWQAMLATIGGIMHFFGRLSFLVDENAHAVHFFVTALLQLLDRAGSLYGELARFILRVLGYKGKPKQAMDPAAGNPAGPPGAGRPALPAPGLAAPPGAPAQDWNSVWRP